MGCAGRRGIIRPSPVASIYVTSFDPALVARHAAVIAAHRMTTPTVWLVVGPVLHSKSSIEYAERVVAVLNAAGVDGVLLDEAWFQLENLPRLRRLVDQSSCYLLNASYLEKNGSAVGRELMIKRVGGVRIGVVGFLLDSVPGWSWRNPDYVAGLLEPAVRQRADLVGALVGSGRQVPGWTFDFVAGATADGAPSLLPKSANELCRLDVQTLSGTARLTMTTFALSDDILPDSAVMAVVSSLDTVEFDSK